MQGIGLPSRSECRAIRCSKSGEGDRQGHEEGRSPQYSRAKCLESRRRRERENEALAKMAAR